MGCSARGDEGPHCFCDGHTCCFCYKSKTQLNIPDEPDPEDDPIPVVAPEVVPQAWVQAAAPRITIPPNPEPYVFRYNTLFDENWLEPIIKTKISKTKKVKDFEDDGSYENVDWDL